MKCPFCEYTESKVIDSRSTDENTMIRRRRECISCGRRFTTYEKVETIPLLVIKKDNTREQYDRSKIESGVVRACYKRAIPTEAIQKTIEKIEMLPQTEAVKDKGFEILYLTDYVDEFCIKTLIEAEGKPFINICADEADSSCFGALDGDSERGDGRVCIRK